MDSYRNSESRLLFVRRHGSVLKERWQSLLPRDFLNRRRLSKTVIGCENISAASEGADAGSFRAILFSAVPLGLLGHQLSFQLITLLLSGGLSVRPRKVISAFRLHPLLFRTVPGSFPQVDHYFR